ncbi:MAG: hypothetical protein LBI70_03235 [Rickettsiales bacterium]|jgi:diacylglycerol kinase family enzyme|nr:hypothetical protein [Rickettsiales bacterium]
MKTAVLIANPLARKYSEKIFHRWVIYLEKIGFSVESHRLDRNQEVGEIIAKLDHRLVSLVVLMAGDGTINSALNAMVLREDRDLFNFTLVPSGTANILCKELGVDSLRKSMEAVQRGRIKRLHMGRLIVNPGPRESRRYFSLMVSCGFDSRAVNTVNAGLKKKIGGLAYVYEFLKILFRGNFQELRTEVDGIVYRNILTCVSNGKYYGAKIQTTESCLENNSFDVVIIKKISFLSAMFYFFTRKNNKNIIRLAEKNNVTIAADAERCPLQIDGDCYCDLPVRVESSDKYINIHYL